MCLPVVVSCQSDRPVERFRVFDGANA